MKQLGGRQPYAQGFPYRYLSTDALKKLIRLIMEKAENSEDIARFLRDYCGIEVPLELYSKRRVGVKKSENVDIKHKKKIDKDIVYEVINELKCAHIREIYSEIKRRYPSLCDDSIRCIHGGKDYGQPEWKHEIRNAIQVLKRKGLIKRLGDGYWKTTQ